MKNKRLVFISDSDKKTIAFGKMLSRFLKKGDIIALCGQLGSGKTTLVKGLAKGLRIKKQINSPSFVILNLYKGKTILQHFDLYRVDYLKEVESVGFNDFISLQAISVIEWADKIKSLLPFEHLRINITTRFDKKRVLQLYSRGRRYDLLLQKLETHLKRTKNW